MQVFIYRASILHRDKPRVKREFIFHKKAALPMWSGTRPHSPMVKNCIGVGERRDRATLIG